MRLEMMTSETTVSPEANGKHKLTTNGVVNPKRPCTRSSVRAAASTDIAAPSTATMSTRQPRIRMYFKDFYPTPPTAWKRNGIRFYRRNFFDQPRMIPAEEADTEKELMENRERRGGLGECIKSEKDAAVKKERVEIKREEEVQLKKKDVEIKKEDDTEVKEKEARIVEHEVKVKEEESVDIEKI